jgi:TolB protein
VYFRPEAGPNGDFWIASVEGSDPPRQLTDDMREGGWPQWTDDGWILFSSARGGSRTLWQVRAEGGAPAPLTSGSGEDDHPELSRDGRLLLYTNVRKTWSLQVSGEAPGSERELLGRLTEILFPQFSPDGRSITFFGRSDRAVAIFTMGTDGDNLRQLTGGTELNHMPRWSPDGDWVYFFQIRPERSFRRVPALGGPSEAVLPFAWETHNFPQIDPSGRLLSYLRRTPGEPPRAVIRDLGTNVERALPDPPIGSAHWSRDGTQLVGHRPDGTIAICPADGSDCRTLVDGMLPVWSADGTGILYIPHRVTSEGRRELWSVRTDGSDARLLRQIGPFGVIDTFFDVAVTGQITWAEYFEGDREIWSAQVR